LAVARLLQDRGQFGERLAKWLLLQLSKNDKNARAQIHRVLAHHRHTKRDLRGALQHMKEALKARRDDRGILGPEAANDLVWAGYEYTCLGKHPDIRRPWTLFTSCAHARRGFRMMREGVSLARATLTAECRYLCERVRFYRIDFVHSAVVWFLLLGSIGRALVAPFMKRVWREYERTRIPRVESMESRYVWTRRLEAQLLSGQFQEKDRATTEKRLDRIEAAYHLLEHHTQKGNPRVYRALLEHVCGDQKDRHKILQLLREAEDVWSRSDGRVFSGLWRVAWFRWYMRLPWLPLVCKIQRLRRDERRREGRVAGPLL